MVTIEEIGPAAASPTRQWGCRLDHGVDDGRD
jgi:hypothetical protein